MPTPTLQGFGLGLRTEHYAELAEPGARKPDWLEILSENYLVPGGKPLYHLDRLRADYPVGMHGVSLSIGSTDPLNLAYLRELKALAERIDAVQTLLQRPLVLENVSSYVRFAADEMDESAFVAELLKRSGCGLLLDVNNVYVSSRNHGFDARAYIDAMPAAQVVQVHLAGHEDRGDVVIDTHDHPICDAVWALYGYTVRRIGARPTMIERDDIIPPLADLLVELDQARSIAAAALA